MTIPAARPPSDTRPRSRAAGGVPDHRPVARATCPLGAAADGTPLIARGRLDGAAVQDGISIAP